MITSFFALFMRNPVGWLVGIVSALLALALFGSRLQLSYSRLVVERQARSIVQLQGTIVNQNANILAFQQKMAANLKASQTALQAARLASKAAKTTTAELASRVLPTAPEAACKAADALILEFAK